ncbi:MAG: hypothetical protein JSV33_02395 [bacterium]|nr:MAG: hypothetical protein JSV33_02395 [bacterium]
MPSVAIRADGKKYMWDRGEYSTEAEAEEKKAQYQKDDFEVVQLVEEGKHLLYTRRVVTEIVLEEGDRPL